ncbi:MAG: glycosyltransferase, partial [Alphaproteobacteria bacterium]|nr:glycosyltransferase [Alphaproteobacteria bacterium]
AGAPDAEHRFEWRFPQLPVREYVHAEAVEAALGDADVVIVHEWTDPEIVAFVGRLKIRGARFQLLFHDTHHRAVSDPAAMAAFDLSGYDGVLAFGEALAEIYRQRGWGRQVFVWHEAADTRIFHPQAQAAPERDVVWIGNWGDGERSEELETFLLGPAERAGLSLTLHGVRYPEAVRARLAARGIAHRGWLANADAPGVYARHRMTVHVPRRPYAETLPGIPTIRVFEALACGIPLISAPWSDSENLFRPDTDFLMVRSGTEAEAAMRLLRNEPETRKALARSGLARIRDRHTCAHRVDELLEILASLSPARRRSRGESQGYAAP